MECTEFIGFSVGKEAARRHEEGLEMCISFMCVSSPSIRLHIGKLVSFELKQYNREVVVSNLKTWAKCDLHVISDSEPFLFIASEQPLNSHG